jgi:hypothetical protein
MSLSRMDLADFGSPDALARGLLAQIQDVPIPVPIDEIARQLDILEIRDLETESFEGGLLTDQEKSNGIILVNAASRVQRRRFTIGHELGHFLCPWHVPKDPDGFYCSPDDMRKVTAAKGDRLAEMEVQANRFSALVLMPEAHFKKDLSRKAGVDIQHVIDLAGRYKVSKEAATRRYVELHGERSAAVISQDGKVVRIYRHPDFPYVDLQTGHPIPRHTLTANQDLPQGEPTDCEETDGAYWLATQKGHRAPTVWEQVLPQQNGFRLTLLSFDEDELEDAEEEESLRSSWTARFHR